jgi:hypothetical protein
MRYFNKKEYMKLRGCTRQAVEDRWKRGMLVIVKKVVKTPTELIAVDEPEYQKYKHNLGE